MSFEWVSVKIEHIDSDPTVVQEVPNHDVKIEYDVPPLEGNSKCVNEKEGVKETCVTSIIKEEICDDPVDLLEVTFKNENDAKPEETEVAGDYPCHLCGAAFRYLSHVTRHLSEHVRQTFPCPKCSREFIQASDLEAHQAYHNSILYSCDKCGEEFISEELFEKHSEAHNSEGGYECTICHRKLKAKYSLKIHMTAMHLSTKPFSCDECHMKFPAQWRLRQHMKLHTGDGFPCTYCKKLFVSQKKLEVHTLTHTGEKPVPCPMCDKRFKRNHNLKIHMRMHMGEKKFVCDIGDCVKAFYTKSDLTSHRAAVHSTNKPRPFKCTDCESAFTKNTQLRRHFINCHSQETPYSCESCNLRFKSKTKWKYHMMDHSGYKPFKCDICGVGFPVKYQLTTHMLHHSTGPVKCDFCTKTFKSQYNVKRHVANVHKKKTKTVPESSSNSNIDANSTNSKLNEIVE